MTLSKQTLSPGKQTPFFLRQMRFFKWLLLLVTLASMLFLGGWSALHYQTADTLYGPRAIYSFILLSLFLALLGRGLLFRLLRIEAPTSEIASSRSLHTWKPLFIFDINAPIYLAAGVLLGTPAAVITALITQIALQIYTWFWQRSTVVELFYRISSTALVVWLCCFLYTWIAGPATTYSVTSPYHHFALSREFFATVCAALFMFCLLTLISLPLVWRPGEESLWRACDTYLRSPVMRFQALVLTVGPLLPIVNIFDDISAELAWLFFLIPLFAIYYLALISTRLSVRTTELQSTLQDLSSARRRQDELRDYASLITRVQEEERRRLARELHDDTAQALIALALGLDGLGRVIEKADLPEKDRKWFSRLQTLADSTLDGVRRACRDLRPSVLDDLGLRPPWSG